MDYKAKLDVLIKNALEEDTGDGDHSTLSCIDAGAKGKAVLKIKEDGVLAGMDVALHIFQYLQPDTTFHPFKKDGDPMAFGEIAFEAEADIRVILQAERLVLNKSKKP